MQCCNANSRRKNAANVVLNVDLALLAHRQNKFPDGWKYSSPPSAKYGIMKDRNLPMDHQKAQRLLFVSSAKYICPPAAKVVSKLEEDCLFTKKERSIFCVKCQNQVTSSNFVQLSESREPLLCEYVILCIFPQFTNSSALVPNAVE